ncbi:MAG: dihydropyrimidinase [Gemmatimonadaceae bacterium]|jgi:dihydropyrimidinase|nr:dihydropyrimidinase [Gemmatimonadaceae bacterium]
MSTSLDVAIRGGTLVTADRQWRADIGIRDGVIVSLGDHVAPAARELDATGRHVLPGGVDAHTHIDQVSSTGLHTADDFTSASRSAAAGGTTTVLAHVAQHRGQSLRTVTAEYAARAARDVIIDYAFHLIVSDPTPTVLEEELPALIAQGHRSLKLFMTYEKIRLTDAQLLAVMDVARTHGALPIVHAEHHEAIQWLTQRLLADGRTSPRWHAAARPEPVEREAVHRACMLAELVGVPLMVFHVSGMQALDEIRRARARGVTVYAETCPQYLAFTAEDLAHDGFEIAKLMFSPAPRDASAQTALWSALADGTLDVFSSDHAPYRFADVAGKQAFGTDAPFHRIPNGVPGLAVRLPFLISEGVHGGRLTLERAVAVGCEAPARRYGLFPQKGTIALGSDADLAIWDLDREVVCTHALMHDRMDYTPYEGRVLRGWPSMTLSRGEVVYADGTPQGVPGRGRWLRR